MYKKVTFKAEQPSIQTSRSVIEEKSIKPILKVRCTREEIKEIADRIMARQQRIERLTSLSLANRMKITRIYHKTGDVQVETVFARISKDEQKLCWRSSLLQLRSSYIFLDSVTTIYLGQPMSFHQFEDSCASTVGLWRPIPSIPWLCVTMELETGAIIVIQLQDDEQLMDWFCGLCDIIQIPYEIPKSSLQTKELQSLELELDRWTKMAVVLQMTEFYRFVK
jgi:hypothetical protein